MRVITRSLLVGFVAVLGAIGIAVAWTMATAVQLLATTALIMGGADHSLDADEGFARRSSRTIWTTPSTSTSTRRPTRAMEPPGRWTTPSRSPTPRSSFRSSARRTFDQSVADGRDNLKKCLDAADDCQRNTGPFDDLGVPSVYPPPATRDIVVFGYSQSAVVASLVKRDLIDELPAGRSEQIVHRRRKPHARQWRHLDASCQSAVDPVLRHHLLRRGADEQPRR